MNKFVYIISLLTIAIMLNACGGGDENFDEKVIVEPAPLNKQAITFPELPSTNTAMPDVQNLGEE